MSNFKQAVSWILHCEELDTVKEVFDLDDQQIADAEAVAEFFTMLMPLLDVEIEFDMLDEVHEWSKK
jgi:hypothetical protein